MNSIKLSTLFFGTFGVISLAFSQGAMANWEDEDCSQSPSGSAPCFEYYDDSAGDTYHFNGDGAHEDVWHGSPLGGDLTFTGDTVLTCPGYPELDCTLTLDGQVKKFEDANGWNVGIKVTDGSISGGLLCGSVDVSGFPWFAGTLNTHDNFGETTGIAWPGPLEGNIGGSPDSGGIIVSLFSSAIVSDSHIHNVTYNNVDTFSFTENLYENGTDDDTGCSVVGDLELQPSADTLSVN